MSEVLLLRRKALLATKEKRDYRDYWQERQIILNNLE